MYVMFNSFILKWIAVLIRLLLWIESFQTAALRMLRHKRDDPLENRAAKLDVVLKDSPSPNENVTFPQFNELIDDIVILILEFVADVPHERPHEGKHCDLCGY